MLLTVDHAFKIEQNSAHFVLACATLEWSPLKDLLRGVYDRKQTSYGIFFSFPSDNNLSCFNSPTPSMPIACLLVSIL